MPTWSWGLQCNSCKALVSNVQNAYAMSAIVLWRCVAEANEIFKLYGCHMYEICTRAMVEVHSCTFRAVAYTEVSWDAWPNFLNVRNSRSKVQVGPDAYIRSHAPVSSDLCQLNALKQSWKIPLAFLRLLTINFYQTSMASCACRSSLLHPPLCVPETLLYTACQNSLSWSIYMQCHHCFTGRCALDTYAVLWLLT